MSGTNSLQVAVGAGGSISSTTNFVNLGGAPAPSGTPGATEINWQATLETAATYSNLAGRINGPFNIGTTSLNFRKNAANGNESAVTTGAGTAWVVDGTHTDSCVAGDKINGNWSAPSGGGVTGTFQVQANSTNPFVEYSSEVSSLGASPRFVQLFGVSNTGGTESQCQTSIRAAATLSGLCTTSSASGTTLTMVSRIGGSSGNQTVAQTSTGPVVDSTHTDSIASGNLVNYQYSFSGGTATPFTNSVGVAGVTSKHDIGAMFDGTSAFATSTSTTYFHSFAGNLNSANSFNTTEATTQRTLPYAFTASNLRAQITANTSGTATVNARNNAANVNQTVSVSGAGAGLFEDTTHTDSYAISDKLSGGVVTGGTLTGLAWGGILMSLNDGSVSGATTYSPGVGALVWTGQTPSLSSGSAFTPANGSLVWTGHAPVLSGVSTYFPTTGALVWTGHAPGVNANLQVSKEVAYTAKLPTSTQMATAKIVAYTVDQSTATQMAVSKLVAYAVQLPTTTGHRRRASVRFF